LNETQGHTNCRYFVGLLVVCINNVSILHRLQDITTFTVYVTDCGLYVA